jgi:hypothetical protein
MTEESGLDSRKEQDYIFSIMTRPALRPTQPPVQWVLRQEREAGHSHPPSAVVKNCGLYLHSLMRLHGVMLN